MVLGCRGARVGLVVASMLGAACASTPAGPPPSVTVVRRFTADWARGGAAGLDDMYALLAVSSAAGLKKADFRVPV